MPKKVKKVESKLSLVPGFTFERSGGAVDIVFYSGGSRGQF